jgi:glycosyltransferase involved in cell wall biosynthesis
VGLASVRVIHTLPAVDIEACGPCYSVPRLCESLIAAGVPTKLAVLDWVPGTKAPPYVERFPLGFGPGRLGRSPAMARWLVECVRNGKVQVIHSHGLWMMPNVYPGRARRAGDVRLVISPRGTVSEWAWNYHRGRKWVMWHVLGQGRAMHAADAFHATSEEEYMDLRRLGFRQPVCVLPNGIDVPPYEKPAPRPRRRLLYLGRIHKKKGIDLLLQAWRAVAPKFPEWELIIAGPDDGGYLGEMQRLAGDLGLQRVSFPGPVYGGDKLRMYRSADLYVLPTFSDNFALTVAEALVAGTPVVCSKGAPWSGLEKEGAGWWVEIGLDPLVAALEAALAKPPEVLRAMGARGREWMVREYSWEAIGRQMASVYRWLCGQGEQPPCVRTE